MSTENIQAKLNILPPFGEAAEFVSCLKPVFHWPNLFAWDKEKTTAKFIFLQASSESIFQVKKYLCVYHMLEAILNDCYVARSMYNVLEKMSNILGYFAKLINTDNQAETNNHLCFIE
jgi:hypothetical protein